jgi:hypothetical protein
MFAAEVPENGSHLARAVSKYKVARRAYYGLSASSLDQIENPRTMSSYAE